MNNKYLWISIILLLIVISWIYFNYKQQEHFTPRECKSLYQKNGITCSILPSALVPAKCYILKLTEQYPEGSVELSPNISDCMYYPDCVTIGDVCDVPLFSKLENGYVYNR
jgi:hypothetical protein